MVHNKLSYDQVKQRFVNKNCIFLDKEYINSKSKLNYLCPKGHKCYTTLNHFSKSKTCACLECSGNIKYEYDYVKEFFNKENYILLSKDYKGVYSKLKYQCPSGHINEINFKNFKNGHRCWDCGGSKPLTYEFVKQKFKEVNYELLSKNYKNNNTKLKYICDKGHINEVKYSHFSIGTRCPDCAGNKLLEYDYVKNVFEERGYILLSKTYIKNNKKMKALCPNKHICYVRYSDIRQNGGCYKCLYKGEQYCRLIFEKLFDLEFENCRPDFMEGLELDGYNEYLQIAFEYNGIQHYKYKPDRFHETIEDFKQQQERDKRKIELCYRYGIYLIVIPYNTKNIKEFIINKLEEIY